MHAHDRDAMNTLATTWRPWLIARARSMSGGDAHLAEDLVQEVSLRLLRRQQVPQDKAEAKALLLTILRNMSRDAHRRRVARTRAERCVRNDRHEPAPPAVIERRDVSRCALNRIRLDDRALMILRFGFRRTLRVIGSDEGLSPGAVDGRIQRALDSTARLLDA